MNDNYEEYEKEPKKFQITRGMLILGIVSLVVILIIIIVIVNVIKSKQPKYTQTDYKYLETRMEEEAPTYIEQQSILLSDEVVQIDLKDLLEENGGSINKNAVKAVNVCKGYVNAFLKEEIETYEAYIDCGDYKTSGYVSSDSSKVSTTTKIKDTKKPSITLNGESEIKLDKGSEYKEEGAKAEDNVDGDITSKIKISGKVNTDKLGTYSITYSVTDSSGNKTSKVRKVSVVSSSTTTTASAKTTTKGSSGSSSTSTKYTTKAPVVTTKRATTPPTIRLSGANPLTMNAGTSYNEPGYSAVDALGANITSRVSISNNVKTAVAGTYTITYRVTDIYGNSNSAVRTVIVKSTSVAVSSISLTPTTGTINKGSTATPTVLISPSNATNKSVSWSTSNAAVASVSASGTITGVSSGSATITATSSNGKKAYFYVTVR